MVVFLLIKSIQLFFVNACSKSSESNNSAPKDSVAEIGPTSTFTTVNAENPFTGVNPSDPDNHRQPNVQDNGQKNLDYRPEALGDCSGLNGTAHYNGTVMWRGIKGPNGEIYRCFNDQYMSIVQTSHPIHQFETNTYKVTVLQNKFECFDDKKGQSIGELAEAKILNEFHKTGDTFTCEASVIYVPKRQCNGTMLGACLKHYCQPNSVAAYGGSGKFVRMELIPEFQNNVDFGHPDILGKLKKQFPNIFAYTIAPGVGYEQPPRKYVECVIHKDGHQGHD